MHVKKTNDQPELSSEQGSRSMQTDKLKQKVREVLFGNLITGVSKATGYEYHYTKPSRKRYPFQYFWDTCFHVHMLLAIDETEEAQKHMESLFYNQAEDGFIGNIVYWRQFLPARFTDFFQMNLRSILKLRSPHMSNIIQPPIVAQTVLKIYEKSGDTDFVKKMLPKLKLYYDWLAANRDFDGDGLLTIITTFESGMDWKATFDPVVNFRGGKAGWKLFLKVIAVDVKNFLANYNMERIAHSDHFRVKDAGFNSIYACNLQDMAVLCKITGDQEGMHHFTDRLNRVISAIIDVLYDEIDAAFYDVYGKDDQKIRILTPTIFYPLMIKEISDKYGKAVMEKHFYNRDEFDVPYPIVSLAKNEPSFYPSESLYIWRGPTWIVHNWFLHKNFIFKEHHNKAEALMASMLKLIDKSGFREYYNPFNGEGYGAEDFTWAGLILDMMSNADRKKKNGD